jgi:hypothetical protein
MDSLWGICLVTDTSIGRDNKRPHISEEGETKGATEGAMDLDKCGKGGQFTVYHSLKLLTGDTLGSNGQHSVQLRTRRSGVRITPGAP